VTLLWYFIESPWQGAPFFCQSSSVRVYLSYLPFRGDRLGEYLVLIVGGYRALAIGARHKPCHREGPGDESRVQELVSRFLHLRLPLGIRLYACLRLCETQRLIRDEDCI